MENVLFVAAVDAEASHVPDGAPLLITGIGTVPAAIELTNALASAEVLPERVINIGTAGALVDDLSGVFEISHVRKHDFHLDVLSDVSRYLLPEVIELETSGKLPTAALATGDSFISDTPTRTRLAQDSELCDMEGYAIAAVCRKFGVPCTLCLLYTSDAADDSTEV